MAFATWNVMAGETPTEAKWNILGDNDDEFHALIQRNVAGTGVMLIDSSGNEILIGAKTASAVNEMTLTNAATAGVPKLAATGGDTNIHIQIQGKGNGLLKTSVLRQDDTTNSYKHNSVILTGWGVLTITTGSSSFNELVTFGVTFAQRPVVVIASGGDSTTASGAAYGAGTNAISASWAVKAADILTTAFRAYCGTSTGVNVGANGYTFYQWIAVGELT